MKANKSKFRRFASRISTVLLTGLAVAAMPKRSEGQCIPVSAYFPVLTCVPVFQPDIPTPSSGTYDYYYEFEGVLMPVPDTPEWWFFEKDCYTAEVVTQGATTISNRAHWGYQLSEIYADSSGCYDIGNHTFAYTIGETGDVTREETSSDAANAGATLVLNKTTTVGDFTYTLQVWEHVSDSGDPYDFHFFSRTVRYTIVGDDYSSVPSTPSGYGIHEILTPTMTPLGESTITVVPTFSNAHFNGSDEFEFTIFGESQRNRRH